MRRTDTTVFDTLGDKLDLVFKRLRGQGRITERHMTEALREIRMALLEADVALPAVPRPGRRVSPGGDRAVDDTRAADRLPRPPFHRGYGPGRDRPRGTHGGAVAEPRYDHPRHRRTAAHRRRAHGRARADQGG